MGVIMVRRRLAAVVVVCAASMSLARARGPKAADAAAPPNEWQAAMRVIEFGYGSETLQIEYDYNIYQNADEVARRELTYASLSPIAEVGRDVHLIDYRHGTVLAFDKHASRAVRYKIEEPGTPSSLGQRLILSRLCRGTRYELDRGNGTIHVSEQWTMTDGDFREPLLRIEYNLGPNRALLTLSFAVVTRLTTTSDLPARLFAAPGGLTIMKGRPGPPY